MITLAKVAFPEPLGPMMACTSPWGTTRSMPFRISLPSTEACRPRTSRIVGLVLVCSAVCATAWSLQIDHDRLTLHLHREGDHRQRGRERPRLSRPEIEHRSVPRALDRLVVHVHLSLG